MSQPIASSTNPQYKIVVNDEEQYSIWPANRANAPGWIDEGSSGTREECLARIREIWTDMRPLSLRRHMESVASSERSEVSQ